MNSLLRRQLIGIYGTFVNPLPYKKYYLEKKLKKGSESKTIIFYPQKPVSFYTIYKICHILGYKITGNHKAKADLVIRFEDTTRGSLDDNIRALANKYKVLNLNCTDISKAHVDKIFKRVFGYSLNIDPQTQNRYVRKSNNNTAHDGKIFAAPSKPKKGFVYQTLINNQYGNLVKDIRVPIIKGTIPFVYYNYKSVSDRFDHPGGTEIAQTNSEFCDTEIGKIMEFAIQMGLDIGELDILRDRDSGKIFIVDVNNTPYGPPKPLKRDERKKALMMLSSTFGDSFFAKTAQR